MKTKLIITVLFLCCNLVYGNTHKIFNINYTSAKIFILKTDGSSGPYSLFNENNQLKKEIIKYEKDLNDREIKRLNKTLNSIPKYDEGTSDWRHVAYAIILYKNKKPVLQIFPNMVGNDVFTVPSSKLNGHGLRDVEYAELSSLYFETIKIIEMKIRKEK